MGMKMAYFHNKDRGVARRIPQHQCFGAVGCRESSEILVRQPRPGDQPGFRRQLSPYIIESPVEMIVALLLPCSCLRRPLCALGALFPIQRSPNIVIYHAHFFLNGEYDQR